MRDVRLVDWDGTPEVPDGWPGAVPIADGDTDADGDGLPDTLVVPRASGGAWVFTDTDANGFADELFDIAPDVADDHDVLDVLIGIVTGRTA